MSTYALVNMMNVVKSVSVFFGTPEWPPEPADETTAAVIIREWNAGLGNPLGVESGDQLLKTDPTGQLRCNAAGVGYTWNAAIGCFVPPQPFASWTIGNDGRWNAPVPYPSDGKLYQWNEPTQMWISFGAQ